MYVNKTLPENFTAQTDYTGKRVSLKRKIKQNFSINNNIIYLVKSSVENCLDNYIGESARRVLKRVKDQSGRDTKLHVLKNAIENEHAEVT